MVIYINFGNQSMPSQNQFYPLNPYSIQFYYQHAQSQMYYPHMTSPLYNQPSQSSLISLFNLDNDDLGPLWGAVLEGESQDGAKVVGVTTENCGHH